MGVESVAVTGLAAEPTLVLHAGAMEITLSDVPTDIDVKVTLTGSWTPSTANFRSRLFDLLASAQSEYDRKWAAWNILTSEDSDLGKVSQLQAMGLPAALLSALTELLASES